MRAPGKDIVELFGYAPNDVNRAALIAWQQKYCPFVNLPCGKTNHDQSVIYGTCSVTNGSSKTVGTEIIICPRRLYANGYESLKYVAAAVWPEISAFVAGGTTSELRKAALRHDEVVVAFGHNSGCEVKVECNGKLSIDWILQRYRKSGNGSLVAVDWTAVEVQSIDTTTNYRENWNAYARIKSGHPVTSVPSSEHGLNWANVHKRLIPQIIRKGNIVRQCRRAIGFFFVVPSAVYEKFKEVIGEIDEHEMHGRDKLSVVTYKLGQQVPGGNIRPLSPCGPIHYSLDELAVSFIKNSPEESSELLDQQLRSLL